MGVPLKEENRLWEGFYKGYRYRIHHNGLGYRCGYVQIPERHPWYGKSASSLDDLPVLMIHGGITFSEKDDEDNTWWIGFDCAHAGDAQDPDLPSEARLSSMSFGEIRTLDYVENECKRMIDQLFFVMQSSFERQLACAVLYGDDEEAGRLLTDYMLERMK